MTELNQSSAQQFEQTVRDGGIVIFPTDTLYGIACDPDSAEAAARIHDLKGRPPEKPSAVMYFQLERLLEDFGNDLDAATRNLVEQLFPGPFTLVVNNPHERFKAACAGTPTKLGLRVPRLEGYLEPLASVSVPVMQTSANFSGGADPTALEDIEPAIVDGVDLALDGGPLLGYASTVADVSELAEGRWQLLRAQQPRISGRLTELIGFPPTE